MLLMSTSRVGSKRCSFIRSMTSTPPALIAAPLTVSLIASSTLEALVHSKLFIASRSFLLVQCLQHDGGRHGKLADADAGRVEHGVCNRGGGGDVRRLADSRR